MKRGQVRHKKILILTRPAGAGKRVTEHRFDAARLMEKVRVCATRQQQQRFGKQGRRYCAATFFGLETAQS